MFNDSLDAETWVIHEWQCVEQNARLLNLAICVNKYCTCTVLLFIVCTWTVLGSTRNLCIFLNVEHN